MKGVSTTCAAVRSSSNVALRCSVAHGSIRALRTVAEHHCCLLPTVGTIDTRYIYTLCCSRMHCFVRATACCCYLLLLPAAAARSWCCCGCCASAPFLCAYSARAHAVVWSHRFYAAPSGLPARSTSPSSHPPTHLLRPVSASLLPLLLLLLITNCACLAEAAPLTLHVRTGIFVLGGLRFGCLCPLPAHAFHPNRYAESRGRGHTNPPPPSRQYVRRLFASIT